MVNRELIELLPREFEHLIFDLMTVRGMVNLSWRTPGADGGRDIEGIVVQNDFSQEQSSMKWFVECKRYTGSVDWPTIYAKLAYAHSNGADVLLMCTPSKFTPAAISQANNWNTGKYGIVIRLWPGHRLESLLARHPDIALKYGISSVPIPLIGSALQLTLALAKSVGTHYAEIVFKDSHVAPMLQASHALATLLQLRMEDAEREGRFKTISFNAQDCSIDGCQVEAGDYKIDEPAFTAFVSYLVALGKEAVVVKQHPEYACEIPASQKAFEIIRRYSSTFSAVAMWGNFEYSVSDTSILIRQRNDGQV